MKEEALAFSDGYVTARIDGKSNHQGSLHTNYMSDTSAVKQYLAHWFQLEKKSYLSQKPSYAISAAYLQWRSLFVGV